MNITLLNNGAVEIARERRSDGAVFVLAMWERNGCRQYISWQVIKNQDGEDGYEHGHYDHEPYGAMLTFCNRVKGSTQSAAADAATDERVFIVPIGEWGRVVKRRSDGHAGTLIDVRRESDGGVYVCRDSELRATDGARKVAIKERVSSAIVTVQQRQRKEIESQGGPCIKCRHHHRKHSQVYPWKCNTAGCDCGGLA